MKILDYANNFPRITESVGALAVWLEYLKENHPDYADIVIDRANLAQLPEDASIMDQIAFHELPAKEAANSDELPPEELPEVATGQIF